MTSITRLVVLGSVRQFQPAHGYFLRRELSTWHVDEWANIQPGSIYNALRSLERDGYISVSVEAKDRDGNGKGPEKTRYSITPEGEVELLRMLRDELWHVSPFDMRAPMIISSFMFALTRQEVIAGLEHRIGEIDAVVATNQFHIEDTARSATTPAYVREIFELSSARLHGEQTWVRQLLARLRDGEYRFADEAESDIA